MANNLLACSKLTKRLLIFFDSFKVSKQPSKKQPYELKKYNYAESDSNSEFDFNLVSSDSDSHSDSDSCSVFMNLVIFIFFDLYLHSSK